MLMEEELGLWTRDRRRAPVKIRSTSDLSYHIWGLRKRRGGRWLQIVEGVVANIRELGLGKCPYGLSHCGSVGKEAGETGKVRVRLSVVSRRGGASEKWSRRICRRYPKNTLVAVGPAAGVGTIRLESRPGRRWCG